MTAHRNVLAFVMAGGEGSRLHPLTANRCKPAVPFNGKHRIVDFVLSKEGQTILSQAGLWAEVYLITGMVMDALHGQAPTAETASGHPILGMKKGAVYSGTFMGLLYGLDALWRIPGVSGFATGEPLVASLLFGALAFPLLKAVIETF
ncbi:MAG: sugar phosphate nucleotidyltransferase, partial [Ramlibacter sp.]